MKSIPDFFYIRSPL